MTMQKDSRIVELLEQAHTDGFTLALTPEDICRLEDAGHIVDIRTGVVSYHQAEEFLASRPVLSEKGIQLALQIEMGSL